MSGPPAHTSGDGDGFPCRGTGMTGEGGRGWGMNNVLGVRAIDQSPLQKGMDSRLGARHRRTFSLASAVMTGEHGARRLEEAGEWASPRSLAPRGGLSARSFLASG